MLHEVRSQSPHHKLKAVYLGYKDYVEFMRDPEVFETMNFCGRPEIIFAGVEIFRVDKSRHIGFGWTDGQIAP